MPYQENKAFAVLGLPRIVVTEPRTVTYVGGKQKLQRDIEIYRGWPKEDGSGFGEIEGLGAIDETTGEVIIPTDRLKDAENLLKWRAFPKDLTPKVQALVTESKTLYQER